MAETQSIQKMAELASNEIFSVFGWEQLPLMNQNCKCEEQVKHRKVRKSTTHPTDAVFKYVDPYSGYDIYVNTDLKSYSKGSIGKLNSKKSAKRAESNSDKGLDSSELTKVLRSLAHSTECANKSQRWKTLYVDQTSNHEIVGMLFIYNHDGGYDANFGKVLGGLAPSQIELENGYFVGVISPKKVIFLNSVAKDIKALRGDAILPMSENCWFFFPHLNRFGAIHQTSKSATLPALMSPLFILGYQFPSGVERPANLASTKSWDQRGYYAYYGGVCEDINECKYLLDYFFKYQIADERTPVVINGMFSKDAHPVFDLAKKEFARDYYPISKKSPEEFQKVLDKIKFRTVQSVVEKFSETELGMSLQ